MTGEQNDMDTPLVSVVICTYNGSRYLSQQLDCIIQQTYSPLEIIISDDCSEDNTVDIINTYCQKDNRIRFFQNDQNLGYNKNFEKACLLATGDYIFISDQDDIWELNKISGMMQRRNTQSDFVYSLSRDFWGDEPIRGEENKPIRYYEGSMPEKLAFDSPIHGHACMFKRTLLKHAVPFPADVYYDWWLSMVASAVSSVSCVKQTFTYHRLSGNNSSRAVLDIREKKVRTAKLRDVCLRHTEAFLSLAVAGERTRAVLEKYCSLLRNKKDDRFSWPFFVFFFQNRAITFHFKRKRNIFSMLKNSYKRACTGL